jgi:SpoVK/Ycf46/Vps4 family AAA+-type ATPase
MAAQVLAGSLGVDLVRIDLSQVISKYIGETAQNLDRILRRAERMDVVLLFDEADAIFGRRTEVRDAHDRYANTDTAYLLQAMEQYPGLAVLSTNRKADIDPAFLRRFRFVVEFEKPGPEHRALMWERVLRELVGPSTWPGVWPELRPAVDLIAKSVEATGAQIKYAALAALLRAEREGTHLQPHHALDAIGHELRKDGRTFTERDRERVLHQTRASSGPDRPRR